MNIDLLSAVKDRIASAPESFRMGAYITEIGERTCGCIAIHTLAAKEGKTLIQLSAQADSTPDGYESKRAAHFLEITPEQGRCLFHLNMWPVNFRLMYKRDRAKAGKKRIEHFIATNGVE